MTLGAFWYNKYKELEIENERLRTRCEQARDEGTGYMQLLEQENAELKAQLQKKINTTTVSDYPYSALKLEEAKEIIKDLLEEEKNNMYWEMNGSDKSSYYEVRKKAEQFLNSEIEK